VLRLFSVGPLLVPKLSLASLCLIAVAVSLYTATHRMPSIDEGRFANPAYNLARHGVMGTTVIETAAPGPGAFPLLRIERHTYWVMPLYLVAEGAWYLIAPATLFWTRFFSILWIPLALWAVLTIAWRATGDLRVGLLAAVLAAAEFLFPLSRCLRQAGFYVRCARPRRHRCLSPIPRAKPGASIARL
jgi:hypothetical protein